MAKEKIDVVIDNVTYKNIDVTDYRGTQDYDITTSGIAQIIKQFVKNNFGDIKVWAKSDSFAGGSSVDVYLWKVPEDWYDKVNDFAERFGMYNEYDGGDGIWRGKKIGATTLNGKSVGNYSPYMHVKNSPPYGSKEYDMPPPNYAEKPTPKKKEYERKGGKYSPTDNLDLVLDCGNGWKIYVGKPKEKYLYNVVKDKDTKQNKEQWAEIKADMLEAGFQWGWKSGTFQRWTTTPDDTLPQQACNVLSKYWGGSSEPKEETPQEPQVLLPQGTEFELIEADSIFKKGETGVLAVDYYEGMPYVEAYMNSEARPDYPHFITFEKIRIIEEAPREEIPEKDVLPFYLNETVMLMVQIMYGKNYYDRGSIGKITSIDYGLSTAHVDFGKGESVSLPFRYFDKYIPKEEAPSEETPKESKKFKVGDKVRYIGVDESYIKNGDIGTIVTDAGDNIYDIKFPLISLYIPSAIIELVEEESREETPEDDILPFLRGETIMLKMPFTYDNSTYPKGLRGEIKNIDYVFKTAYVYFYGDDSGNYPVPFEYLEKFVDTYETPKEVNLDEYLNDLNVLLEIEDNETKRLELATYISDLNTLKLLQ